VTADRGGPVAIVAALPEELAEIARRSAGLRAGRGGGVEARVGRLGPVGVVLTVTGDGPRNAERGLGATVAAFAPVRCVVVGLAGALTADFQVGDVVAAARIVSADGEEPAPDAEWLAALGLRQSTVYTSDRIAHAPRDKAVLRGRLPSRESAVVDLESAAFARVAAAAGTPFLVLRAVSDLADEALPLDFERFRDADGAVSRGRIAWHAALRPGVASKLYALRRRAQLCAVRLADAVEEALAA
jgi:adenosylhomocysteine nucleosidase